MGKQITPVLPHPEVVNQIKLPSLCLSFRLTWALSGCVLAGPFYWNSLKHRASFVVRFFFPSSPIRCLWKRTGFFGPGLRSIHQPLCLFGRLLSTPALVNSLVLNTLFITLKGKTLLILFWTCSDFAWNITFIFIGISGFQAAVIY